MSPAGEAAGACTTEGATTAAGEGSTTAPAVGVGATSGEVGAVGVVTFTELPPLSKIRTQSTSMVAGNGAVISSGVRKTQEPELPLLPHPEEPLLLLPPDVVKPPPTATLSTM